MTQTRIIISGTAYCIDMEHLCSGNDFKLITNNFDRKTIFDLCCMIRDITDRNYVIRAIDLSRQMHKCPQNDDDKYFSLLYKMNDLEKEYHEEKQMEQSKAEGENNSCKKLSKADEHCSESVERFTVTKIGFFFYFVLDALGIHLDNDDTKNCKQKAVKIFLARLSGYSIKSFDQKLIPDFKNKHNQNILYNLANGIEAFLPKISENIRKRLEDA